MSDNNICLTSTVPMCDTFRILNFSFSNNFSAKSLINMFTFCGCLEEINLTGFVIVVDVVVVIFLLLLLL